MIRRIRLRSWKAYEDLELELHEGTTFLVADNGVGKTSVVQAIYFAMFGGSTLVGSSSTVENAVRGGVGSTAEVECSMTLDGIDVEVKRTVTRTVRAGDVDVAVWIDGETAAEDAYFDLLKTATDVDAAQLGLLAIVPEGAVLSANDAGSDIANALSRILGVDRLQDVAEDFARRAAQIDRQTDQTRKGLRDSPQKADRRRRQELASQLADLNESIEALQVRLDELQARESAQAAWREFHDEDAAYRQELEAEMDVIRALSAEVAQALPVGVARWKGKVDRVSVGAMLDALSLERERVARLRGQAEGRVDRAEQSLEALDSDGAVCPVCLRPMSESDSRRARAEHRDAIAEARRAIQEIGQESGRLGELAAKLVTFVQSPQPVQPTRPPVDSPAEASVADSDSALGEVRSAMAVRQGEKQRIADEIRLIDRMQEQHEQDRTLSAQLRNDYGRAERAYVAASTLRRVAETVSSERIAPLAREIQKRWTEVWSAEPLTMDGAGRLHLVVGENKVPFSEFSGGQRTLAHVMLRLLALQMATRSPFFILDEPLEHLDPRNRRLLATLLVRAAQDKSQLDQVIVTTYEESVTRRLSSWRGLRSDADDVSAFPSRVHRISSRMIREID